MAAGSSMALPNRANAVSLRLSPDARPMHFVSVQTVGGGVMLCLRRGEFGTRSWFVSIRCGVAWFRCDRRDPVVIRAPWDRPLFSERNGLWPHRRFLGFRWGRAEPILLEEST